jgi:hypothetical protein
MKFSWILGEFFVDLSPLELENQPKQIWFDSNILINSGQL